METEHAREEFEIMENNPLDEFKIEITETDNLPFYKAYERGDMEILREIKGEISENDHLYDVEYNSFDIFIKNEPVNIKDEGMESDQPQGPQNYEIVSETQLKTDVNIEMFKCSYCLNESIDAKYCTKCLMLFTAESDIYKCDTCEYETNEKHLKRHNSKHKSIVQENNSKLIMYTCKICGFQTKHKASLAKHTLRHKDYLDVEQFKCHICCYFTKYRGCLSTHMKVHQELTELEMFKCEFCSFQSKYKHHIKRHSLTHKKPAEQETYTCPMCNVRTKGKDPFTKHMKRHDNPEIFKCIQCSFGTKYKTDLVRHLIVHKNPTEIELHKCRECKFTTKHKNCLKRHIRTQHATYILT